MKNVKCVYMDARDAVEFISAFNDAMLSAILPGSTEEEKEEMIKLGGEFLTRAKESYLTHGQMGAVFLELAVEILKAIPALHAEQTETPSCPKTHLN